MREGSVSPARVRRFQRDDVSAMITIFRTAVREVARRHYSHAQVMAWAPDVIDAADWEARCAGRQTFVAEMDGLAVGFTELLSDGHLDMMYVDARHQGRGIASALLAHAESAARGLRLTRLFTEASISARPFFERRGFLLLAPQVVSRRGQEFINYRMEKPL